MSRSPAEPSPLLHSSIGTPLEITVGAVSVRLVNGVFGDPLLEVRFRGSRRRLLFDLGDSIGLSRRDLHRVTEVFLSHAHFDHICGFLGLLRSRIDGRSRPCRMFGPPGTAGHVAGFVSGFHWDRIEDDGPQFLVGDVEDVRITWQRIQPGRAVSHLGSETVDGNRLFDEGRFSVSALRLDHGIPVLAFSIEVPGQLKVREDRLGRSGYPPGSWLGELKRLAVGGRDDEQITLPDGTNRHVGVLRKSLLRALPGTRLVYATDFADTASNRERLTAFATNADLLICESTFRRVDRRKARDTRHLTTDACAAIAREAKAARLLPFHFSKRYVDELDGVYGEIERGAGQVEVMRAERR